MMRERIECGRGRCMSRGGMTRCKPACYPFKLMIEQIEQRSAQVEALCRKHQVKRLDLFGSPKRGDFDPVTSDLDFFVEFESLGWRGSSNKARSFCSFPPSVKQSRI